MTLPLPDRCSDLDAMQRRGALALFLALALALAAGLIAWGPLMLAALPPPTPANGGARLHGVLGLIGGVALVIAGLGGWRALRGTTPAAPALRPWRAFFASLVVFGLFSGLRQAESAACARLLTESCCAITFALLFVGVLSERVDRRFGTPAACLAALLSAVGAAAWFASGLVPGGLGDVRGLVFIAALPLLLLLAGVAGLRVAGLTGDGLILLSGCTLARVVGVAEGEILAFTGFVGGQSLMELSMAAIAGWFALRQAARRAEEGLACPQPAPQAAEPSSARSTSFNTTG